MLRRSEERATMEAHKGEQNKDEDTPERPPMDAMNYMYMARAEET